MRRMKLRWVLLSVLLLGCGQENNSFPLPETPQEMYEHAQRLLKPNVEGQASDFAGALEWTRKAAQAGWLPAIMDMGYLCMYGGKGIAPDAAQARVWYTKAAEQGEAKAHWFLGVLDYDAPEGKRNAASAMEHWRKAADAGVADAQYRLGRLLAQHKETVAEGMQWLEKAAAPGKKGGVPQAATALANLYMTGANGAPQDVQQAVAWFAAAAGAGDALAQLVYAEMLLDGSLVPQDTKRGMTLLRLSAGQDYPRAIARLINLLRNGENPQAAEKEAAAWDERLQKILQNQ